MTLIDKKEGNEANRLLSLLTGSIFFVEFFIMLVLTWVSLTPLTQAIVDSLLLITLVSPVLYFLSFRPLMQEIQRSREADIELTNYQQKLEELVTKRTKELQKAKGELEKDVAKRKETEKKLRETVNRLELIEKDLQNKVTDLEKWQKLTVNREHKMIELKKEIKTLKEKTQQ
jgi:ABC-type multidrug transport system fused ATPase/permease subunit